MIFNTNDLEVAPPHTLVLAHREREIKYRVKPNDKRCGREVKYRGEPDGQRIGGEVK